MKREGRPMTITKPLDFSAAAGRVLSPRAAYALVTAVIGLALFASATPSPIYGLYRQEWGFSSAVLTLIYATYAFGVLAALLLAGRVSGGVGAVRSCWARCRGCSRRRCPARPPTRLAGGSGPAAPRAALPGWRWGRRAPRCSTSACAATPLGSGWPTAWSARRAWASAFL